jgi:hypothetical protein
MLAREKEMRGLAVKQSLASVALILPAVFLPRLLIPVTEDFQIIGLSAEGLLNAMALFFIPSFPVNFIFSVIAYFLPLLLLTNRKDICNTLQNISHPQKTFLIGYTSFVLLLSFFGGTDYNRFASFLFLPQIVLIGLLETTISNQKLGLAFLCILIFNRLWINIPDWDVQAYRDFFGGFALQLNVHTAYRFLELLFFIVLGFFINWKRQNETKRA